MKYENKDKVIEICEEIGDLNNLKSKIESSEYLYLTDSVEYRCSELEQDLADFPETRNVVIETLIGEINKKIESKKKELAKL